MIDQAIIQRLRTACIDLDRDIDRHHAEATSDAPAIDSADARALAVNLLYTARLLLRQDAERDDETCSAIDMIETAEIAISDREG